MFKKGWATFKKGLHALRRKRSRPFSFSLYLKQAALQKEFPAAVLQIENQSLLYNESRNEAMKTAIIAVIAEQLAR